MINRYGIGLSYDMKKFKGRSRKVLSLAKDGVCSSLWSSLFWFIKFSQFKVFKGKALTFNWVNETMATYAYVELARVKYLGQS